MVQTSSEWNHAFVLHRRPYRNSSYILDIFCEKSGRVSAVANSARGQKSRFRGQLEPFTPLSMSWRGKTSLKTVTGADVVGLPITLTGDALWCGFYLNELLLRMMPSESPHPRVFAGYQEALLSLRQGVSARVLRQFECLLLEDMGYALPLSRDMDNQPISAECFYRFYPDTGFVLCEENKNEAYVFSGECLLQLLSKDALPEHLEKEAKRLLRLALAPHLGSKPLGSRQLFQQVGVP